jgi:hypothetical protein
MLLEEDIPEGWVVGPSRMDGDSGRDRARAVGCRCR